MEGEKSGCPKDLILIKRYSNIPVTLDQKSLHLTGLNYNITN